MKQILAFGDSNTWGLIPCTGERYPDHIRWTGILWKASVRLGFQVQEDGLIGRTTVFEDPSRPWRRGILSIPRYREMEELSAVILMLGTNDCKKVFRASPEQIGCGMEQCIRAFEAMLPPGRILVVSPILLGQDVWRPGKDPAFDRVSVKTCACLREVYEGIAKKRGNIFLAASDHALACHADEEHLNAEGHARLAAAIVRKLVETGIMK